MLMFWYVLVTRGPKLEMGPILARTPDAPPETVFGRVSGSDMSWDRREGSQSRPDDGPPPLRRHEPLQAAARTGNPPILPHSLHNFGYTPLAGFPAIEPT